MLSREGEKQAKVGGGGGGGGHGVPDCAQEPEMDGLPQNHQHLVWGRHAVYRLGLGLTHSAYDGYT